MANHLLIIVGAEEGLLASRFHHHLSETSCAVGVAVLRQQPRHEVAIWRVHALT
jgi:hypothetical protein